jgi:hypothetical protein
MRRATLLGLAFALLAGPALSAEDADKGRWQGEYRQALQTVDEAWARVDRAEGAYRSVRHRDRVRGAPKAEAEAELEAARAGVERAEQQLEALVERARRAEVPPGWLREVDWEREGAAAAPR